MSVITISSPEFDLAKTLNSGQVFHWFEGSGGFFGLIDDLPAYVQEKNGRLIAKVESATGRSGEKHRRAADATIQNYFALDHRLTDICHSFPNDPAMNAAADYCRGLRIIRQPKWECLATFICSSMKQVAHIRQMSQALRKRFGERREIDKQILHTFPAPERLAEESEKELRRCGLGYRAKNLLATARLVASGQADLERWAGLPDMELGLRLCELPGVGPKVANCAMLFGYQRLAAFPVDVWIERVLREQYFAGKKKPTAPVLKAFAADYFGPHGGYAQQYLFHHARTSSRAGTGSGGPPNRRRKDPPRQTDSPG
jgi:N-glycosylase/DNA lyase